MPTLSERRPDFVHSVAVAFDEDGLDRTIAALASSIDVAPREYLKRLALHRPIQAQVNFQAGPSLELDPSPFGLTMLANFMENVAPEWRTAWYADTVLLTPAAKAAA